MARLLKTYRNISGTIVCRTGLRIGGAAESLAIGSLDNTVIRHPLTEEPYIPGSSLKGKVRTLLEYRYDRRDRHNQTKGQTDRDDGGPCECGLCLICRVFGAHKNPHHRLGPTRALFRDALLHDTSRQELREALSAKGILFAEVKVENRVRRTTGIAEHPRTQERVPAGTMFHFDISVRIFDDDDEAAIIGLLKEGLTLLQQDYLGASGSRGYGQIQVLPDE